MGREKRANEESVSKEGGEKGDDSIDRTKFASEISSNKGIEYWEEIGCKQTRIFSRAKKVGEKSTWTT